MQHRRAGWVSNLSGFWAVLVGMRARLLGVLAAVLCALLVVAVAGEDSRLAFATSDDSDFQKKGEPKPGDWLDRFEERGQSFRRYVRSRPVRAREEGEVLAFLPVGRFSAIEKRVFERTVELARVWFDLDARVLESRPLPREGWQRFHLGRTQYRTGYFLRNLLPDNMPPDAVCLFGVTMADLYVDENWNFVFGAASLRGRVGVYSFVRYFASFRGELDDDRARLLALRRACKVVVHEIGHTFGMEHCIRYECLMNGSNSLEETDRQPLRLCPPCLKKLQWNRGFNVVERYRKLSAFFKRCALLPEARRTDARLKRILEVP
jgi:archaemetzincin